MEVYFIRAGDGPVKIGRASNVPRRLVELQCAHYEQLTAIRTLAGPKSLEGWFHREFAHLRIRGEWFEFSEELLTTYPPHVAPTPVSPVESLIKSFGGLTGMARALGHKHVTTVQGWRESGKIPPYRHYEIIAAADREGVHLPNWIGEAA